MANKPRSSIVKKILIATGLILLVGSGIVWYIFNEKFEDTATVKADQSTNALELLHEFRTDIATANKNYTEKILSVKGTVSEIEKADTTFNIKMSDSTGAYLIFAFQSKNQEALKSIKEGDLISVKGSCSGGTYSKILETFFVAFKRCVLEKQSTSN